jgi:hypothetical protein
MNTNFATLNGIEHVEYLGSLERPTPIIGQVINHHKIDWVITGTSGTKGYSVRRLNAPIQYWEGTIFVKESHNILNGIVTSLHPEPSDDVFADEGDFLDAQEANPNNPYPDYEADGYIDPDDRFGINSM